MDPKNNSSKEQIEKELSIVYDALASMINGVIITDLDGIIEYANPAFIKMFEYNRKEDIIGKHAANLFVRHEIKTLSDVERIIGEEQGGTEEFIAQHRDGSEFWVEVSSTAVTDKNNRAVGRMASFVDITDRKITEKENIILSNKLLKSQEMERQRISQDLHDSVAQTIHAAKLNFIAFKNNPSLHSARFNKGLEFIDKVSEELREVCNDLYPTILRDYGLESTIKWYAKNYLEFNNVNVSIDIKLDTKIEEDMEINLYRIIKEAFSNIIKHSKASHVLVKIIKKQNDIYLSIKDNGTGFDARSTIEKQSGFGLSNIQQRIKNFGGTFSITSTIGKGTEITSKMRVS